VAKSGTFRGKEIIELGRGDVVALEEGPGVRVGVCGVHTTNVVEREPTVRFIAVKGLKGAREDDSSEIPEDGTYFLGGHG
jgi:hypothetical protein